MIVNNLTESTKLTALRAMPTCSIHSVASVATGRRRTFFERLAAWFTAPGIRALDTRTLADIQVSDAARAEAELRQAWRDVSGPGRWHGP